MAFLFNNMQTLLHNGVLNGLYSSPNIIRVIKSRTERWVQRVARMGDRRVTYTVLVEKPEENTTWKTQA